MKIDHVNLVSFTKIWTKSNGNFLVAVSLETSRSFRWQWPHLLKHSSAVDSHWVQEKNQPLRIHCWTCFESTVNCSKNRIWNASPSTTSSYNDTCINSYVYTIPLYPSELVFECDVLISFWALKPHKTNQLGFKWLTPNKKPLDTPIYPEPRFCWPFIGAPLCEAYHVGNPQQSPELRKGYYLNY